MIVKRSLVTHPAKLTGVRHLDARMPCVARRKPAGVVASKGRLSAGGGEFVKNQASPLRNGETDEARRRRRRRAVALDHGYMVGRIRSGIKIPALPQDNRRDRMMDVLEVTIRLAAATIVGAAIGLNRDLHGKPTGVRTLGIVALGSALIVMASGSFAHTASADWNAMSRAIQGLITGIGFLGAGVIMRTSGEQTHVHGLTTAASIWRTACFGVVCAVGVWGPLLVVLALAFLLLVFGGPVERFVHSRLVPRSE
jgi:putative Mg2+ transporter-C (MgtC) family protein